VKLDDDDFALFELPRRFAQDRAELDTRWRRLQASAHPDRFASQGAAAQRVAMQWSVRINEAYRRLRDPMARAAYLCELHGVPIDAERNTAMPAEFLRQQMTWREALDDADSEGDLAALADQVRAAEAQLLTQAGSQLDDALDPSSAALTVRALMFVARLRSEIDRRQHAFEH
jgi:molecular chaperone HscB